jgi:hypothetical protein
MDLTPPPPGTAKADLVFEMKALERAFKSGKSYNKMKKHELELRLNVLKKAMGMSTAILPTTEEVVKPAASAPLGARQIPVKDVLDGTATIKVPTAPPPRTNTATRAPQRQANKEAAYAKVAKEVAESPVSTLFAARDAPKAYAVRGTATKYEKKLPTEGEPLTFGQKMAIARAAKKAAAATPSAPVEGVPKSPMPEARVDSETATPTAPLTRKKAMKVKIAEAAPLSLVIGEEAEADDPISRICRRIG